MTGANFLSQSPVTLAVSFSFIFDYIAHPAGRMLVELCLPLTISDGLLDRDDDDDFLYGGPSELNSRPSTAGKTSVGTHFVLARWFYLQKEAFSLSLYYSSRPIT